MAGSTRIIQGDARHLDQIEDESVDVIITSPPYPNQRSYRATCPRCGGSGWVHVEGQIGSEAHPSEWLEAMWSVMRECWRVLKPTGSCFINLGDKRAGSGGPGGDYNSGGLRDGQPRARQAAGRKAYGRPKSRQATPERFLIGCMDGLADPEGIGWIYRQCIVWAKPNGLPESVTDRPRDDFEFIYMFTKEPDYFAGIDEIRELQSTADGGRIGGTSWNNEVARANTGDVRFRAKEYIPDVRGKLPGSVWTIPSEPLNIPDYFVEDDRGWRMWGTKRYGKPRKPKDLGDLFGALAVSGLDPGTPVVPELAALWTYCAERLAEGYEGPIRVGHIDHFAAFPCALPEKIIRGFAPTAICTACGEGRRPVVEKSASGPIRTDDGQIGTAHMRETHGLKPVQRGEWANGVERTILGYACACPEPTAPTRPAVVLDVFGGTGTTAVAANALGRDAILVDISPDYCRLARWRVEHSGHGRKVEQRSWEQAQQTLL